LPGYHREELLFDDVGARGQHRLGGEDGRDRADVAGEVEVAPPGGGDILQEGRRPFADGHNRGRSVVQDAHLLHGRDDAGRVGAAIGQEDDVLEQGGVVRQVGGSGADAGQDVRSAPGAQRGDLLLNGSRVLRQGREHHPRRAAVKADDADAIHRVEQVDRADDRLLGQVDVGEAARPDRAHRAGRVDHEEHGQGRQAFLVAELHLHRQGFLQRCAIVAADAVALVAANDHQPAAQVAYVSAQGFHPQVGEIARRDVDQDHAGIAAQRGQADRQVGGRGRVQRQPDLFQRRAQMLNIRPAFRAVSRHQQHPRRAGDFGEG